MKNEFKGMSASTNNRLNKEIFNHPATEVDCKTISDYINDGLTNSKEFCKHFQVADFSDIQIGDLSCHRFQIEANSYGSLLITVILLDGTTIKYNFYKDGTFTSYKTYDIPQSFHNLIETWGIGIIENLDF